MMNHQTTPGSLNRGRVRFEQLIVRTNLTNRQTTKAVACRTAFVAGGWAAKCSLVCASDASLLPFVSLSEALQTLTSSSAMASPQPRFACAQYSCTALPDSEKVILNPVAEAKGEPRGSSVRRRCRMQGGREGG